MLYLHPYPCGENISSLAINDACSGWGWGSKVAAALPQMLGRAPTGRAQPSLSAPVDYEADPEWLAPLATPSPGPAPSTRTNIERKERGAPDWYLPLGTAAPELEKQTIMSNLHRS
jgi:hypothetical protein